jgi:tripartite-type tricarboxylate transporter receptor subunit TctC
MRDKRAASVLASANVQANGHVFRGLAVALTIGLVLGTASRADELSDFYHGKSLTMVIGYDVGGGYDLNARLLSRHLGRYIPGNPSIVPQNRPGAGSIAAIQYMYNVAPRDGTSMATASRSVPLQPLLAKTAAKFDPRQLTWIGSIGRDTLLCVSWHSSPIKVWRDMLSTTFTVGAGGAGGDTQITAQTLKRMLGARINLVSGYPSNAGTDLAMERGEIDGHCGYSWSTLKAQHAEWLRDKKINLLIQIGMEKHPDLPDVPSLAELIDADHQRVLKLLVGTQVMARPFFAPPQVPASRKEALRQAFNRTMQDPSFLEEAKRLLLDVEPMRGEAIDALMADLYSTPRSLIDQAISITGN